jgi:Zn-dependent protease
MRPSIRLGRIAGIEVGIHWTLLIIGAFLVTALAGGLLPELQPDAGGSYWAAAILATALFFASILAHELAHSLVAIRRGQRVEGITLWLFGGIARLRDEARDARSELLVALAGPATSVVLGGALLGAAFGLDAVLADGSLLPAVAFYLGAVNIFLGLFNLLPGAPLDGGRVLGAVLWAWHKDHRRAQITAARAGRVVGGALIALAAVLFVTGQGLDLWLGLIGWFVIQASASEELQARVAQRLDGRTIAQLMGPPPPSAPEWTPIPDLAAAVGDPLPTTVVLTAFGGEPSALLLTGALRAVPDDVKQTMRARDLAVPLVRVPAVAPDTPAREAIARGLPLAVVVEGRIVGVVGFDELRRAAGNAAVSLTT